MPVTRVSRATIPMTLNSPSNLRFAKIPLSSGTGAIPALGFGTLIPDPAETKSATTNALRVGFRHLDCAERYRNEREVGESLAAEFATHAIAREEVFVCVHPWLICHLAVTKKFFTSFAPVVLIITTRMGITCVY